ncbi:MAG: F0F1 ATP synthase subunit epsilon [Alphaproteobacteria bacterium]
MADTFTFELVSPDRLLLSEQVEMVVVPGEEGDFGVLPGHAPVISAMRPGLIAVYDGGQVSRRLFVSGGFAEVSDNRLTVLAQEADSLEDLDRGVIEQRLKELREDLADSTDEREMRAATAAIAAAEARLAVLDSAT